jgi:demethylmenaquinone methyltransferase/2-methoxy-6-polyprenyl-1,4-benzoquinol methylase
MFGRIAGRYDLMNRLMTGWQDGRWRRRTVRAALDEGATAVLDVATGTGDLAFALAASGAGRVVGLDFAPPMIARAEAKRQGRSGVDFLIADAMRIPFAAGTFDACTIAFGLRNMPDYRRALLEMGRVLRPGGRLVCLELTPFRAPVLGWLFGIYFARVVPLIGRWLTGDRDDYRYLPSSVAVFPDATALRALMLEAGFDRVEIEKIGGGTVALHIATRSEV